MAEKWQVPIFIHPWETLGRDRMPHHNFMYTVGMPSETALAAATLIWRDNGEVSTAKGLFCAWRRIFPIYFAKVRSRLESMAAFTIDYASPSYYAKKFYFDSLNYDPINLKYMIERFGHEKIFMGSDYPFYCEKLIRVK